MLRSFNFFQNGPENNNCDEALKIEKAAEPENVDHQALKLAKAGGSGTVTRNEVSDEVSF